MQDSLAAEVLLSLCPSGFREIGSDVGDGVVESAAPLPADSSVQDMACDSATEPVPSAPDEQVRRGTLFHLLLVCFQLMCVKLWLCATLAVLSLLTHQLSKQAS